MTTLLCILLALALAWLVSAWFWLRKAEDGIYEISKDVIDGAFALGPVTFLVVGWWLVQDRTVPWLRKRAHAIAAKWKAYRG